MDSFATLSNNDREVIESGDEEVFLLYIMAHIFLGKMYLWYRRVGDFFFEDVIKAIRNDLKLDAITTYTVLCVIVDMGYATAGTLKVEGAGRENYLRLTDKGRVQMVYWHTAGEDLAFEMVREWHIKHRNKTSGISINRMEVVS